MQYLSTRGSASVTAAQAVVQGICPAGGLYVPASYPQLDPLTLIPYAENYREIAWQVMRLYFDQASEDSLRSMIAQAYGPRFDTRLIAPVRTLNAGESVLELWHGPTLAFKDMALQMLPHLMRSSMDITGVKEKIYILVATSGDTGKAALEGFCNVPGTCIQVFYPDGGVSKAQRLQMVTQQGDNVFVCAVKGNFDDAQTGVKKIFADPSLKEALAQKGCRLSSANSINFGRLLPQIVYYFSAYAQACKHGSIAPGAQVNFCVPTGNFGDILAGYYAMRMGLPVHKLICASNRNHVLTDFFRTGRYDSHRPFYKSMSCSIDILVSSNLERLLFDAADRNPERVSRWMNALSQQGYYEVGEAVQAALGDLFWADWCDEEETLKTIHSQFQVSGYLMDPHTAVAQNVYRRYAHKTGDATHTILLSTANPFKFATDVLSAFETPGDDDFQNAARLSTLSGMAVPEAISGLAGRPVLHPSICALKDMPKQVLEVL